MRPTQDRWSELGVFLFSLVLLVTLTASAVAVAETSAQHTTLMMLSLGSALCVSVATRFFLRRFVRSVAAVRVGEGFASGVSATIGPASANGDLTGRLGAVEVHGAVANNDGTESSGNEVESGDADASSIIIGGESGFRALGRADEAGPAVGEASTSLWEERFHAALKVVESQEVDLANARTELERSLETSAVEKQTKIDSVLKSLSTTDAGRLAVLESLFRENSGEPEAVLVTEMRDHLALLEADLQRSIYEAATGAPKSKVLDILRARRRSQSSGRAEVQGKVVLRNPAHSSSPPKAAQGDDPMRPMPEALSNRAPAVSSHERVAQLLETISKMEGELATQRNSLESTKSTGTAAMLSSAVEIALKSLGGAQRELFSDLTQVSREESIRIGQGGKVTVTEN